MIRDVKRVIEHKDKNANYARHGLEFNCGCRVYLTVDKIISANIVDTVCKKHALEIYNLTKESHILDFIEDGLKSSARIIPFTPTMKLGIGRILEG